MKKISVITPSLNQGEFLEATIDSVLSQRYPKLEYLILDGGSIDGSVGIIKKYEKHLAFWSSGKDAGQSSAINKGMSLATGDILCYLSSDDLYTEDCFARVNEVFETRSEAWIVGTCRYLADEEPRVRDWKPPNPGPNRASWVVDPWVNPQASSFWSKKAWKTVGPFREDLHYIFDTEFFLRLLFRGMLPCIVDQHLATRVLHDGCKTITNPEGFHTEKNQLPALFASDLATLTQTDERRIIRRWETDSLLREARLAYGESRWKATEKGLRALVHAPAYTCLRLFTTATRRFRGIRR